MLETLRSTILFVSALFPVVNPLGGSPIFGTLTRGYDSLGTHASFRAA